MNAVMDEVMDEVLDEVLDEAAWLQRWAKRHGDSGVDTPAAIRDTGVVWPLPILIMGSSLDSLLRLIEFVRRS
jgi:hypothetical protein